MLDAPGSKYCLADSHRFGEQLRFDRHVTEMLLPSQQEGQGSPLNTPGRNDALLVLANLSVRPDGSRRGMAQWVRTIKRLLLDIQQCTGLHQNGAVRMLLWVDDKQKDDLLPRTVYLRNIPSIYAEALCHVEEIAGGGPAQNKYRRDTFLDVESSTPVRKSMEKLGVILPSSRVSKSLELEENSKNLTNIHSSPLSARNLRDWEIERSELEKRFREGEFSQIVGGVPGVETKKPEGGAQNLTPEFKRMRSLQINKRSQTMKRIVMENLLAELEGIDFLDLSIHEDKLDDDQKSARLAELDERIAKYKDRIENTSRRELSFLKYVDSDRKAFRQKTPILAWDRRSAEPFLVRDHEFYPNTTMTLLDLQPKVPNLLSTLSLNQMFYFNALVAFLMANVSHSLPSGLEGMAPGAADAVLPKVPSARDPRKGGRRDLTLLWVKIVTLEMLRELAVAWDNWPFRPSAADLSRRLRSGLPEEERIR